MMDNIFKKILMRTLKIKHGLPVLLNKVDFVMFPARAMAKMVQKVGEDLGETYLNRLGYDAGLMVAKEFVESLNWVEKGLALRIKSIFTMFEVMGFGKIDLKLWDTKESRILLHLINHPVIIYGIKLFGKRERICSFYMGIFSAHAHYELKVNGCNLIETQCISRGAPYCEWSYNYFKKTGEKKKKKKSR
ncbi:hypothetical protein HZA33_04505 [Candidatus Pacearchaeota archaeon]|nr:hypothetical protein [Candidatus Pacearchaeota archaeon]